ncbi:hypothetical protein HDU92_002182 [Lobulomyces angularis]|nr:hypothetical protein HDU92_002182 [Lobulomyces angularis]
MQQMHLSNGEYALEQKNWYRSTYIEKLNKKKIFQNAHLEKIDNRCLIKFFNIWRNTAKWSMKINLLNDKLLKICFKRWILNLKVARLDKASINIMKKKILIQVFKIWSFKLRIGNILKTSVGRKFLMGHDFYKINLRSVLRRRRELKNETELINVLNNIEIISSPTSLPLISGLEAEICTYEIAKYNEAAIFYDNFLLKILWRKWKIKTILAKLSSKVLNFKRAVEFKLKQKCFSTLLIKSSAIVEAENLATILLCYRVFSKYFVYWRKFTDQWCNLNMDSNSYYNYRLMERCFNELKKKLNYRLKKNFQKKEHLAKQYYEFKLLKSYFENLSNFLYEAKLKQNTIKKWKKAAHLKSFRFKREMYLINIKKAQVWLSLVRLVRFWKIWKSLYKDAVFERERKIESNAK